MSKEYEPRIYVACLAAYNAGRLHGRWIDADQSAEEVEAEVQAMLKESPEPGAEEWAIHDFSGFGEIRLNEWDSFERVSELAAALNEHGEPFEKFYADRADEFSDIDSAVSAFEDAYRGEWGSLAEYVEDFWDQTGELKKPDQWWHPINYIDWERMARDLELNGDVSTAQSSDHKVYVYDR